MRDSQPTRTTHSRTRRRAIIAAVILAASPLGAQQPQYNPPQTLPPLPLMASTGGAIKGNPFSHPAQADIASSLLLASSRKQSA